MLLAIRPELVHGERLPEDGEGMPLGRLKTLSEKDIYTGIWWYADNPTHYNGDGRFGTAVKGETWFDDRAKSLASVIRVIKEDREAKRLQDEFFVKMENPEQ